MSRDSIISGHMLELVRVGESTEKRQTKARQNLISMSIYQKVDAA